MTDTHSAPALFGLEAWTEYLADKSLPVRTSTLTHLRRALNNDRTTLVDLSHLIRRDPVLTLHVTRLAQQQHARKGSEVTGIDHAIASIGFGQIGTLADKLETIKLHAHNVAQKSFFRAIADSQHAATQAASWAHRRQMQCAEEVRLAALFYGLVHWLLWLYAPLHKHRFQIEVIEQNASPVEVERRIFGCTTQELGRNLAETWQLTTLTQQALDHSTSPSLTTLKQLHLRAIKDPRLETHELRQLNHLLLQHYYPVKLANWLALTVGRGWHHPRAARMFDIVSDYLDLPLAQTLALLHTTCANAAREYHVPGTMTPAAELILLPSNQYLPYRLTEREIALYAQYFPEPSMPGVPDSSAIPAVPDSVATPLQDQAIAARPHEPALLLNPFIYEQISERLQQGYELYTQPAHVMQGLLQGLHRGLGLERLALCLIKRRERKLVTARTIALPNAHPLHAFELDLTQAGLFTRLAEKVACVMIAPGNREQLRRALPVSCRDWLTAQDALLMSIADQNGPLAIIYADRGEQGSPLTDFHQQHFRTLCANATLALKRLTARPARD